MLELQHAKKRTNGADNGDDDVQQQIQFQENAWPLIPEKAQGVQKKTKAGLGEPPMQCDIYSSPGVQCEEVYTDAQARLIVKQHINDQKIIVLDSKRILVKDAMQAIGEEQRQRALAHIMQQLQPPKSGQVGHDSTNVSAIIGSGMQMQQQGTRTPDQISNNGYTPPRVHNYNDDMGNHDHEDDNNRTPAWVMNVPSGCGNKSGGGDGGSNPGGGDDGGDGVAEVRNAQDGDREGYSSNLEFTLVNSRNIEIKKFIGDSTSKMTYLEFNESQRELIGIKGKDGLVLNRILTWAEQRGEDNISNLLLKQFETKVPKIWEYDRAVHAALKNWTEGEAKRVIKYEVEGVIDACRKLYIEDIYFSTKPNRISS